MNEAFICDAVRTPFGRYGGALSSVRADDLGAVRGDAVEGGSLVAVELFDRATELRHPIDAVPVHRHEQIVV